MRSTLRRFLSVAHSGTCAEAWERAGRALALFGLLGVVAGVPLVGAAELPEPKTGVAGKPICVLFLSDQPTIDDAYRQALVEAGYVVESLSYYQPYKLEFFRKFNVIVIDSLPGAGNQWETFGQRMLYFWENFGHVQQCLEEGGGVLVHAFSAGGSGFGGWNERMRPFGVGLLRSSVRDDTRKFKPWNAYGENFYCWTEKTVAHPITDGIKRIYYPSANLRWDEFYTSPPLLLDASWTPLVTAEPEARAMRNAGHEWSVSPDAPASLVIAAVRDVGKGRLGVIACDPGYIHRHPYLAAANVGEMSYGPADGIAGAILDKGNGDMPSDSGKLVDRMMRWLAGTPAAAGFGGYQATDKESLTASAYVSPEERDFERVIGWDNPPAPPSWKHRAWAVKKDGVGYYPEVTDPLIKGDIRYFKALVGVHSALSDGKGTVGEYAAAAREAGYSLVCFAEAFEHLTAEEFRTLAGQCAANSTDEFKCLPGYDIMDSDGNHLIVIAAPEYPQSAWLTEDGKRVKQVQMLNLGYYNHKVVAHKADSSTVLPQERLKHFQGLSVYTYRDGKMVDDSSSAYAWQAMNGSAPQPIVVHEVYSPAAVATAAATGFQQIMPADTVENAVSYFRIGIATFFEAPPRYVISEGPVIRRWVVAGGKDAGAVEENRMQFQVRIGVDSDVPLKSVALVDGYTPLRRWLPTGNTFDGEANLQHSHQYGVYVVVEDSKGRRAISAPVRTVAQRYHYRCSDRQNWLGHCGFHYTGTWLPERLNISMPVKGTVEGSAILTAERGTAMAVALNFPFTANNLQLTEAGLNQVYTWALWNEIGFDAMPSWGSKPSTVYGGKLRHWSFTNPVKGQPYVTLVELALKVKRDVEVAGTPALWPSLGALREKKFARMGADGQVAVGDVAGAMDMAPGTLVGGIIALSDNLHTDGRQFGMKTPEAVNGVIAAGTELNARFLIASSHSSFRPLPVEPFDSDPAGFLKAMGFAGPTPYRIALDRGTLNGVAFIADVSAEDGGVAGQVATPADIPYRIPLRIPVDSAWVAGIWQEGQRVRYSGVFEDTAWPQLDVSKQTRFYAGNLLTSDNEKLVLQVVTWTPDRLRAEVHNPTDKAITATVRSPVEITGLKRLDTKVAVPAGSTVYAE